MMAQTHLRKTLFASALVLVAACGGGSPDTTAGDGNGEGTPTETRSSVTETTVDSTTPTDSGPAGEASGDCETDIAALEPIIEEHGLISNLTAEEVEYASSLISSIGAFCSIERGDEFFAQPEVDEFMSG